MKKYYITLIIFLTFTYIYPSDYIYVKKVIDGDTVIINDNQYLRYLGIDAPEKGEDYYYEAKEYNKKMVEGKKVKLEYDIVKYDNYNRLLAYVYTADGKCLNEEIVRKGLAYLYPHPFETLLFKKLLEAQRYAIDNRSGIWRIILDDTSNYYIASKKGMRFHNPNCPWAKRIYKRNIIIFHSKKEAFYQGFAPCRRCRP